MVAGAALLGAAFLDGDVLASYANIEVRVFSARISGCQLGGAHFENRKSCLSAFYPARNDGFDTGRSRDLTMLRPGEDFLRWTSLQDTASVHNNHLVAESQGVHPVVRDDDGRNSQPPQQMSKLGPHMISRTCIQGGQRLV